jgi:hypothetical protein
MNDNPTLDPVVEPAVPAEQPPADDLQAIEEDIAATREDLRDNVAALQDKITPSRVVGRRVEDLRQRAGTVASAVMGTAGAVAEEGKARGEETASAVRSSVGTVTSGVGQAPQQAREAARGNPVAAGLLAFALGWLAGSMLPLTRLERRGSERALHDPRVVDAVDGTARAVRGAAAQAVATAGDRVAAAAHDAGDTLAP